MSDPKILVIYHSLEGNTQFVAKVIAEETGADLLRLEPKNEIAKTGSRFFWGGSQVFMKKVPELKKLKKDPTDYDLIFLGTPIWAWSFTPPIRSLLKQTRFKKKKFAFFCTHEGNHGKTFEKLRNELKGNKILGEINLEAPLKRGTEKKSKKKLKKWVAGILEKV